MAEVALSHVSKTYDGDVVAVKDATFTVHDRELVVLVGPSGCGKSTLLRVVAGLESITEGSISIDDQVVNDVPPRQRDIAMVFQNYALYPHRTVFDNMALSLKIRKTGSGEIRRRVEEVADLLGIGELLDRRPRQLSGGQRQRVALGRAIVRRPKVFLFDEPLSNLDAKMRVETRTELSRLHRELKATMIYVTHDQTEAMTMGSRIVVLKDGVVQQIAAPLDLYERPRNRFVAGFVGSPAMNFWPASVVRDGDTMLQVGSQRWVVQGRLHETVERLAGRDLVLGVRPEDVRLAGEDRHEGPFAVLDAELDVVEPLGSETLLYWRLGEHRAVARVGPMARLRAGARVGMHADLGRAHWFDPESGETLFSGPTPRGPGSASNA